MEWPAVALAAFVVGTAGNSVKAVPQFLRTAVHGRVAGLSPAAVWLAFTANVLWLCFGIAIQDWLFAALGVVQTVLTGCTLLRFSALTGWRRSRTHALTSLGAWVAFVALAVTGSGLVLESLGAALGIVLGAPQVLSLWRTRHTVSDVTGVAGLESAVVVVAQAAWTVYWLVRGHPIAAAGAAWGLAARAVTWALLRQQRARARARG